MQYFSSTDVAKKFGAIAQIVQTEPVCVQSYGRPQMVMLSPKEYERLCRLDRRVYSTDQLPSGFRAGIATAKPSVEAAAFNSEVEG